MVGCGVAVVSLALLVMVIYGLLGLAWLDCGLWHHYGGQHSDRLGYGQLGLARHRNALLGFAMVDLVWLRFGVARLGYVMVDFACLWLGVAPQWAAMVGLAWLGLAMLWLTWLVFGLAWHRYARQWSAWFFFFGLLGLALL
jgi:hypothetical protein